MQEEERLKRIKLIEEKKHLVLVREKMITELEDLKKNPFVERYFELDSKLKKTPNLSALDVEREIYSLGDSFSCLHDVCVLMYGEKFLENGDYEHLGDLDNLNGSHYFIYKCLECGKIIKVFVEWNDKFLEKHRTIRIPSLEFEEYRKRYFEFLLESPTDEAYQKLKKLV